MGTLRKTLASLISERRRQLGLSQEKLAERVGIHRTYVSQLERGLKVPTMDVFLKICGALEIRASEFIWHLEEKLDELQS